MYVPLRDYKTVADGDGAGIAYCEVAGPGLAIVDPLSFGGTIAGLAMAHTQQSFLDAMSAGHQIIWYDQRGAAASAGAGVPRDWEQRGEDLWRVADAAGIERAVLYGVFDAGHTIAHAAVQQPERVLGLIFNRVPRYFIAEPGDTSGLTRSLVEGWFSRPGTALHVMQSYGITSHDAEVLAEVWDQSTPPDVTAKQQDLLLQADLRPLLDAIKAPALVIAARRRQNIRPWGETLGSALPTARLVRPASAGEALGAIHAFLSVLGADIGRSASTLSAALSTTMSDSKRAVGALRRIVVPVDTDVTSGRAVELACRLGEAQKAEIVLVHAVVVPHSLALDHPRPEATYRGERALMLGRAIVADHGLPCRTKLVTERSAAGAIVRLAREEEANLIVMEVEGSTIEGADQTGDTAREVLRRAPCEVLLDRSAR